MMWFKREPKPVTVAKGENGVVSKLRRKKATSLKPTRESSERETSTESEVDKRRYSDILDMKNSAERRDESDESLYESADCHSDVISASDDALPRLGKTPTMSKESLKLAVTDEEVELRAKKGHRKAMSLSNPLEMVRSLEWLDSVKSNCDKHFDKKKSRESLWSEEDRESIHGSNMKLDQVRKNSKKEDKRKNSADQVKTRKPSKASSVSALNLFRRKKTPIAKSVEAVSEVIDKILTSDELLNLTKFFLEEEKRHSSVIEVKPPQTPTPAPETDSDEEAPVTPKPSDHRRRLSRQASRSKSKARGKSQSVKVNTLRKSHSGTLKKAKKKGVKTPTVARSRQTSIVEATPLVMKKRTADTKQTAWLFSSAKGEARREGSAEDAADAEPETDSKDAPDKDNNWRTAPSSGRGVNRAESCRERDAPRRGKHRNASDPNRLTAHNHHDLEPAGGAAPSGSSSSSSLSSRSNESNTAPAEQQAASQSDWSDEEEPLAAQWADSLPPHVLDSLTLTPKQRKRQEVIHELIVSERSHARWLKVLDAVFLRALEAPPPPLPPDELRALFPNLPAVRERHGRLYADLKALRAAGHVVQIRPVADAILNTLGDPGYAPCLSKFCRGQRMALEALRERRRKSKELHALLASREQLPLCGRLQLRDLLACVWQRLTKYQLLLESLLATVTSGETEADAARLRLALHTAKDVLHTVDTAVRTAENEHRLKSIQSKLEVRANGSEWEELRRLDLTQHTLRMEGDLAIRNDSNKKISVLALMLEDILVLLQREGDKFVLKPVTQPSQQGLLSPLIRWDKVLFRPNAAVRNAFFLMNINGVQMHELSTNTSTEYTTWVKHIQDAPLAKLTDLKPHAPRQAEDSGTNVSRNPSDASEKSEKSEKSDKLDKTDIPSPLQPEDTSTPERQLSRERSEERERAREKSVEDSRGREGGSEERERERHTSPRRPTVGRISTVARSPPPLEQVLVAPPLAHTCHVPVTEYTSDERLRRLDRLIASALAAKASIVGALLDAPAGAMTHLADIARADTLCDTDIASELRATRLDRSSSVEEDMPEPDVDNIHPLLLTAYAQATELTETLSGALRVSPARLMRARRGRCDQCAPQHEPPPPPLEQPITDVDQSAESLGTSKDASFDMLSELANMEGERSFIDPDDSASALATRLLPVSAGLQAALSRLLVAAPLAAQRHVATRSQLTAASENQCRLRTKHQMSQEMNIPDDEAEETIQDQPSNGG